MGDDSDQMQPSVGVENKSASLDSDSQKGVPEIQLSPNTGVGQ